MISFIANYVVRCYINCLLCCFIATRKREPRKQELVNKIPPRALFFSLFCFFFLIPLQAGASDRIPPTGSIKINNGALYTNLSQVTLNLSARDAASSVTEMKFSLNGTIWGLAEPYFTTKSWALITGDGKKTIYVKYKDGSGNWSLAYKSSITLDTTPPKGKILINKNAATTSTPLVTLNPVFTDAGSGLAQSQFSDDNLNWTIPETYAAAKSWVLTRGNGVKTVYAKFSDRAGNWSGAYSDTITLSITKTPSAPTIDKVRTPTIQNFQSLSGKKLAGPFIEIIVTSPTASPEAVTYPTTTSWRCMVDNLTEGINTITVKSRNWAGTESAPAAATIVLDTQGPVINILTPTQGQIIKE